MQKAKAASEAKSDFLSKMSHDIRTPLNAIMGMTTLAKAHIAEPEKIEGYLKNIEASSSHLLGLINDVLDVCLLYTSKRILLRFWTHCQNCIFILSNRKLIDCCILTSA